MVFDKSDYDSRINDLLSGSNTYAPLKSDLTGNIERKLNTLAATLIFFLKNRLFSGAKDFFFVTTSANNNAYFIDAYAK